MNSLGQSLTQFTQAAGGFGQSAARMAAALTGFGSHAQAHTVNWSGAEVLARMESAVRVVAKDVRNAALSKAFREVLGGFLPLA